jgi:hypothetical protein
MLRQQICKAVIGFGLLFVNGTIVADELSKPFSADQVLTTGGKTTMGKVFAANNAVRFEDQEGQFIDILRADRGIMWALLPARKVYLQLPLRASEHLMTSLTPRSNVQTLHRDTLGSEQVSVYRCDKSRVQTLHAGKAYIWIEWAAKELNGFVVKRQDEKGSWSIEYRNVLLGPQDASLFEVPAGYHRIDMSGMEH